MSAIVYWDFAVYRWGETMREVFYTHGPAEVDKRCDKLPKAFRQRLMDYLSGEDKGGPY